MMVARYSLVNLGRWWWWSLDSLPNGENISGETIRVGMKHRVLQRVVKVATR